MMEGRKESKKGGVGSVGVWEGLECGRMGEDGRGENEG